MKYFIADFHIHSKYSRATSKEMDVENLSKWARQKGIALLGTGDFTHPEWFKELKEKLEAVEYGIFRRDNIYYMLTAEVSNIYFKQGKSRKIHNIVFSPTFEIAQEINKYIRAFGDLRVDGRPIIDLDCEKMVKAFYGISPDIFVVPGHIWTPWFSLFGSNSGFDSIEECFEEQTKNIHALETGLSSDSLMNWRWSSLDKFTLISNSDAHCVHPDTNIYTVNSKPIPIKKLNPSKVLSIDFASDLKQREGKISKLHKLPSPPILYKIATRTKEIVITPEHRFFVLENEEIIEKKAYELKKGSLVACLRQISHEGKPKRLPSFDIDHEVKILPEGIDYLRILQLKNKRTQNNVGKYIGVKKDCIWIFEKKKVKTPKENFIDKYCKYVGINKDKFKKEFLTYKFPLEKSPEFTNEKFCQILGYVLGDGGIEHSKEKTNCLSLTDKNRRLLNHYQNLIREVFNIEGRLKKDNTRNSNSMRYPVYLAEYFQRIDPKILVPSPKRQIPGFIFNLPKKEIAAFLGGFFDAEGTNGHHFVQFTSSSLILIKEIQALLLKFGLHSYIYPNFEKNKKKWRYRLNIYSQEQLKKFTESIKFSCNIKRGKLLKYLSSISEKSKNSFVDPLPIKEEILKVKRELLPSYYDIPKRLYYHLEHNNTFKRGNVKEFIDIFSNCLMKLPSSKKLIIRKLIRFAESDIIWESVQEIKKIKSNCKYVYDLTVPNYENYVANGFITHNSPKKIGREANVFKEKFTYKELLDILKKKDKERFLFTVEFFPQEGKYHWDGHRNCNSRLSPKEAKKINERCPVCGRRVTVGVMHRLEDLADREEGFALESGIPFRNLVSLDEIIADAMGIGKESLGVEREYNSLIQRLGSEFEILLEVPDEELLKNCNPRIARGILKVRKGEVEKIPGYDGEYGKIKIFKEGEEEKGEKQLSFF